MRSQGVRPGSRAQRPAQSRLARGEGGLGGLNVDLDKLYSEFLYKVVYLKNKKQSTKILDELGQDFVLKASLGELDPLIGREKEINNDTNHRRL